MSEDVKTCGIPGCLNPVGDPAEDFHCHGCGVDICDDWDAHPNDGLMGAHNPEDHNTDPYDDAGDEGSADPGAAGSW